MTHSILVSVLLSLVCAAGCAPGDICDEAAFRSALASARIGDTVELGQCEIEVDSTIVVPQGVTVEGAGRQMTTISGTADMPVLSVTTGEGESGLSDLTVRSDGGSVAVFVDGGAGAVALRRVDVEVTRGIGVAVRDVAALAFEDVSVRGPVTPENAPMLEDVGPDTTAVSGLFLDQVERATLGNVTVNGFAGLGVEIQMSASGRTTWSGGDADRNAGVGLVVRGGTLVLDGVRVCETAAIGSADALYAVYAGDGAHVDSVGMVVDDNAGRGVVHVGASGIHDGIQMSNNGRMGMWLQGSSDVTLMDVVAMDNREAGVVAIASTGIQMLGGQIGGSRLVSVIEGGAALMVGDGIQMIGAMSDVTVQGIQMIGNGRVGMLLDAGGGSFTGTIDGVTIEGSGDALGAIGQNGAFPSGWDAYVTRTGDTGANDAAFSGTLDTFSERL